MNKRKSMKAMWRVALKNSLPLPFKFLLEAVDLVELDVTYHGIQF